MTKQRRAVAPPSFGKVSIMQSCRPAQQLRCYRSARIRATTENHGMAEQPADGARRLRCRLTLAHSKFSNKGHAFAERKVENLQPGILLQLVDENLDATLVSTFGAVRSGDFASGRIVEKNDSSGVEQSLKRLIVEASLLRGVISVH